MTIPALSELRELRALIIGDVMIDSYFWGKVERISPEAPVPVVDVSRKENRLGGAANVALNVLAFGATPLICSVIGDDEDGDKFLQLMRGLNLSTEGIVREAGRPTTVKTRVIGHQQQMLRIDSETTREILPETANALLEKLADFIRNSQIDVIIFEDYDKGVLSASLIARIMDLAAQNHILTVADPKKKQFLHYRHVDLFKPNLKELREGLKLDIDPQDKQALEQAVDLLRERTGVKNVMVTLSEHGVYVRTDDAHHHIPAHVRDIADVSGAGDTVIATTALFLAAGLDPVKTAELANLAGGLVCEHVGVVPVDSERLMKEAAEL